MSQNLSSAAVVIGALRVKHFSRQQKQTTFVVIVIPGKMISFDRQPLLKIDRLALLGLNFL